MVNLISSGMARLWRSKVFWLCAAVMFISALSSMIGSYFDALKFERAGFRFDSIFFSSLPFVPIVSSVFSALFMGNEYASGAVRNKIIAGYSRYGICLSYFFINWFASMLIMLAWGLGGLIGFPMSNGSVIGAGETAYYLFLAVISISAMSAILTLAENFISEKIALSAVVSVLLPIILVSVGGTLYGMLCEPEMASSGILIDGVFQITPPAPNPNYVSGFKRDLFEFILDIDPMGQAAVISNMDVQRPVRMIIFSFFIIAVSLAAGLIFFKRKNLK